MYWWIPAVALFIIFVAFIILQKETKPTDFPYKKKPSLLTPAEQSFYGVLNQVIRGEFNIFTKVRVSDIVSTQKGLDNSKRTSAFNKITSKHVDFVLCGKNDYSIVAVIELDDKSHQKERQRKNDAFKDKLFQTVGIPIIRFKVKNTYSMPKIHSTIASALSNPITPDTPLMSKLKLYLPHKGNSLINQIARILEMNNLLANDVALIW